VWYIPLDTYTHSFYIFYSKQKTVIASRGEDNKNPFAHVSFATYSSTSPAMKSGKALAKTPAPPSFTQRSTMTSTTAATFAGIPTPAKPPTASHNGLSQLAKDFRQHVATLPIRGAEWTSCMLQYKEYREALEDTPAPNAAPKKEATVSFGATTTSSTATTPPAASSKPAATATATSPSQSNTPTLIPPNSVTAFGKTPPAAVGMNPHVATGITKFYQVRAKYHKWNGTNCVPTKAGILSLEHDANGKRIVIRMDGAGTIHYLSALPSDLRIVELKTQKGKLKRFIQFVTRVNGGDEPVPVRLETAKESTDVLYEKIRELGEKVMSELTATKWMNERMNRTAVAFYYIIVGDYLSYSTLLVT